MTSRGGKKKRKRSEAAKNEEVEVKLTPWQKLEAVIDPIIAYSKKDLESFEPEMIMVEADIGNALKKRYKHPTEDHYIHNGIFEMKFRCFVCERGFSDGLEDVSFIQDEGNWSRKMMCPQCVNIAISILVGKATIPEIEQKVEEEKKRTRKRRSCQK